MFLLLSFRKNVKAMHEIDEYSTISQLALAWVNVAAVCVFYIDFSMSYKPIDLGER